MHAPMGFTVEYSGLAAVASHVMYKAFFVFALTRWVLSWLMRHLTEIDMIGLFSFLSSSPADLLHHKTSPCPTVSSQAVRDSLVLATFGDMTARLAETCDSTCAVCLERLRKRDEVRVLGNCCHIFHRACLDRWVDHDTHRTCPLCRSPLLTTISSPQGSSQQQPSWVVERLLYLFGDDLLI